MATRPQQTPSTATVTLDDRDLARGRDGEQRAGHGEQDDSDDDPMPSVRLLTFVTAIDDKAHWTGGTGRP
jgi:hypothetical protein